MKGKKGELLILLDQGGQSSQDIQENKIDIEDTLDLESSGVDAGSARIYLNTMASFSGYSSGSYALTALKKMTGTDSFLKQTDEEKKCRIETLEDCQAKSFIDRVQEKCGCVPWAISTSLVAKVDSHNCFSRYSFPTRMFSSARPTPLLASLQL